MTATRTSRTPPERTTSEDDEVVTGPAATDAEPDEESARADSAVGTAEERPEPQAHGGKLPWIVLAVLVLLLVSAVATSWMWLSGRSAEADRTAAADAASSASVALTSINFGTADQDIKRVIDAGTGEFGDLFRQNLDPYVHMVRDSKVTSRGEVTSVAVSRADARSAQVLVAMRSSVQNASSPQEQQRLYRMKLDMVKEGDRWLVSKLEFVG